MYQCGHIRRLVSIHASRGGSDFVHPRVHSRRSRFQSTLPVGGATRFPSGYSTPGQGFNPRFPWGERLGQESLKDIDPSFNPRFPWGERPLPVRVPPGGRAGFNPRFPWGERLFGLKVLRERWFVSIHASRGGSDNSFRYCSHHWPSFNPRFPWGERQWSCALSLVDILVSIHASRGGSDERRRSRRYS